MLTSQDILHELNRNARTLKESYSVSRIGLFGSFVHGQANSDSDIDIVVDLAEPSFDHYMDLKFFLEDLFGRSVDLVLADTVKPRLKPVIKREVMYAEGLQAAG